MTDTEFRALLMSEYTYWRNCGQKPENDPGITMGAMGSVSNVLAAMHGSPAPWHPRITVRSEVRRLLGWLIQFVFSSLIFWAVVAYFAWRGDEKIETSIAITAAGFIVALITDLRRRKIL